MSENYMSDQIVHAEFFNLNEARDIIAVDCCGWQIWDKYPDRYVEINEDGVARGYVERSKFVPWTDANQAIDAILSWAEKNGKDGATYIMQAPADYRIGMGENPAEKFAHALVMKFLRDRKLMEVMREL